MNESSLNINHSSENQTTSSVNFDEKNKTTEQNQAINRVSSEALHSQEGTGGPNTFTATQSITQNTSLSKAAGEVLHPSPKIGGHRVVRDTPQEVTHLTAKRVAFAAIAVITSPVLVPLLATIALGAGTHKFIQALKYKIQENALISRKNEVKCTEKKAKVDYLTKPVMIRGKTVSLNEVNDKAEIQSRLAQKDHLKQTKLGPFLLNALVKKGVDIGGEGTIKQTVLRLCASYKKSTPGSDAAFLQELNGLIGEKGAFTKEELNEALAKIDQKLTYPDDAAAELHDKLAKLQKAIENKNLGPKARSAAIIAAFREVLRTPAYQAMKNDPSNPIVQWLHTYAVGIWSQVKVMNMYQEFGKAVIARDDNLLQKLGNLNGEEFGEVLESGIQKSIETLKSRFFVDAGIRRLAYIFRHPKQAVGAMASTGSGPLRELAAVLGIEHYDPHGSLTNVPSLQATTTISGGGTQATIQNVYGGTPTIDDAIAPEFLAVIQAAQNNQCAPPEHRIAGVPDKVLYTNFQNIEDPHGEGDRSKAIMHLNEIYPLAFQGITLAKDSDFYRMPSPKDWKSAETMGEEMKKNLMNANNFKLPREGRQEEKKNEKGSGPGCYFPGRADDWEKVFNVVIEEANGVFRDKIAKNPKEAFELRGAYQEYVYASIQNYVEIQAAAQLKAQGVENAVIHSQRACKENIDRGGAANAAYLYLRLGAKGDTTSLEEQAHMIVGALHCRALGARDRMILEERLHQILAMIKHVNPDAFHKQQARMLKKFGFQNSTFTPAITAAA